MKGALALRNPIGTPIVNDNSSANVPSASYLELSASLPQACSGIEVQNTSSKAIKLAIGAAASEQDQYIIAPGVVSMIVPVNFAKGARLSARALGADATTGFLVVNFLT